MISQKTVTLVCVFICLSCPYSLENVLSYKEDTVKEFKLEDDTVKEFSLEEDISEYDEEEVVINSKDTKQYKDCGAVRKYGDYTKSGVYRLSTPSGSFKIFCIHEKNNSYNVIQRRMYGNVNFNRFWHDYKYGFGNQNGDYWAGLNNIYYLTTTGNNILTVNLQDWASNSKYARYSYFKLTEPTYYTLNINGYSGNAGDSMEHNNGMRFATRDNPDNHYCAMHQQTGWWFNYCTYALLNGKYYPGGPYTPQGGYYDGIFWYSWGGYGYSMKFVQMMLSSN